MLNSLARDRSNSQMIHIINQENPQIREMHAENSRLRAALEDHQHTLELVMTKYREHTQSNLGKSKLNFHDMFRGETEKNRVRIPEDQYLILQSSDPRFLPADSTSRRKNPRDDRNNATGCDIGRRLFRAKRQTIARANEQIIDRKSRPTRIIENFEKHCEGCGGQKVR